MLTYDYLFEDYDYKTMAGTWSVNKRGSCPSTVNRLTIPTGVKEIQDSAFEGVRSVTEVILPNSVKTIGTSAFVDCPCLTRIRIPDSVTKIGGSAFEGDYDLVLSCQSDNVGAAYARTHSMKYVIEP